MPKLLEVKPKGALFLHSQEGKGELGDEKYEVGTSLPGYYLHYKGRYCLLNLETFVRTGVAMIDKELDNNQ